MWSRSLLNYLWACNCMLWYRYWLRMWMYVHYIRTFQPILVMVVPQSDECMCRKCCNLYKPAIAKLTVHVICALSDVRIHIISTLIVSPWYSPYMGHVWWVPGHTWPCIPQLTDTQDRSTGNSNYRWQIYLLYINLWCISYSCALFLHMEENDEDRHMGRTIPYKWFNKYVSKVASNSAWSDSTPAGYRCRRYIAACGTIDTWGLSIYGGTEGGKEACSYDA